MSLTDHELVWQLKQLDREKNVAAMRDLLKKEGGIGRIITLAERGLGVKPKQPTKSSVDPGAVTLLPDDFPDADAKAKAVTYWQAKRRPDLVARVDERAEAFRDYHGNRNSTMAKSWPLTWQTWYTNDVTMQKPPRAEAGQAPKLAFEQTNEAGWAGRVREFYQTGYWGDTWGAKPPADPKSPMGEGCMVPSRVLVSYALSAQRRA